MSASACLCRRGHELRCGEHVFDPVPKNGAIKDVLATLQVKLAHFIPATGLDRVELESTLSSRSATCLSTEQTGFTTNGPCGKSMAEPYST